VTGATDSFAWRTFGNDYWYSSIPEHVSFVGKRWFENAAATLGLEIRECRFLSSVNPNAFQSLKNLFRLLLYTSVARLRRKGCPEGLLHSLPLIRRISSWTFVPWWPEARDHMLVVLQCNNG